MFRKKITHISAKLRKKYPLIIPYILNKSKTLYFWHFKNERQLIRGNDLVHSIKTSIIFFTIHKCVSSYVKRIISLLAEDVGMRHIDFESYFNNLKKNKKEIFSDKNYLKTIFKDKGYYYGSFKTYRNIPHLNQYKIVLMLRDPRDILVSQYYSMWSTNNSLSNGDKKNKHGKTSKNIDEHVLESAKSLKTIYETYCDKLLDKDNVLFIKYEDMLFNYDHCIEKLIKHIQLDSNCKLIQYIKNNDNFILSLEKEYMYKIILRPGEYKDKLKEDTIKKLNDIFANVYSKLNYNK